jgi:hypothetical protein
MLIRLSYFMFLFPLPMSVANCIEKLQCDFLWGKLGEEFKYHLVRWSMVYSPISVGGLGVRNLLRFNNARLSKWLWRCGLEREDWWIVVVDSKYESLRGGWCSSEPIGACGRV